MYTVYIHMNLKVFKRNRNWSLLQIVRKQGATCKIRDNL